ncbi:hypothetical protein AVEN_90739-1 [Araneus ventricosus]|uniref:DDE-1 domain-containing protein n=1 Tax=Araneus ventricosus TaxID=182803 RepID=A0A4Y2URV8_ARAVE|nr:hypothetical protein AVEN_90739-1 [Araneus ventricosus]
MKDRVTILGCANASGLHRVKLTLVEKSKKPRCFKNINNGLIHHPWLNHDQRLNDGSAMIMRKVTEMHCQMYTLLGCYIGMVSQSLCCWRFLKLPSAFEPNEFLANSPVRGYIQPIISVSIRLFV